MAGERCSKHQAVSRDVKHCPLCCEDCVEREAENAWWEGYRDDLDPSLLGEFPPNLPPSEDFYAGGRTSERCDRCGRLSDHR